MSASRAQKFTTNILSLLPPVERLQLLALLADDIARQSTNGHQLKSMILWSFTDWAKKSGEGIDPQQYVDQLRSE